MASLKRSDFEPEAETRPSKRATASSANGGVREALAPNIDKDPTTPRRDQRRPSQSRIVIRDEKDSSSEASSASEEPPTLLPKIPEMAPATARPPYGLRTRTKQNKRPFEQVESPTPAPDPKNTTATHQNIILQNKNAELQRFKDTFQAEKAARLAAEVLTTPPPPPPLPLPPTVPSPLPNTSLQPQADTQQCPSLLTGTEHAIDELQKQLAGSCDNNLQLHYELLALRISEVYFRGKNKALQEELTTKEDEEKRLLRQESNLMGTVRELAVLMEERARLQVDIEALLKEKRDWAKEKEEQHKKLGKMRDQYEQEKEKVEQLITMVNEANDEIARSQLRESEKKAKLERLGQCLQEII